ncbi:hypothetical protein JCM10207_008022 [Rhodosporidiobolus poonsookiae]
MNEQDLHVVIVSGIAAWDDISNPSSCIYRWAQETGAVTLGSFLTYRSLEHAKTAMSMLQHRRTTQLTGVHVTHLKVGYAWTVPSFFRQASIPQPTDPRQLVFLPPPPLAMYGGYPAAGPSSFPVQQAVVPGLVPAPASAGLPPRPQTLFSFGTPHPPTSLPPTPVAPPPAQQQQLRSNEPTKDPRVRPGTRLANSEPVRPSRSPTPPPRSSSVAPRAGARSRSATPKDDETKPAAVGDRDARAQDRPHGRSPSPSPSRRPPARSSSPRRTPARSSSPRRPSLRALPPRTATAAPPPRTATAAPPPRTATAAPPPLSATAASARALAQLHRDAALARPIATKDSSDSRAEEKTRRRRPRGGTKRSKRGGGRNWEGTKMDWKEVDDLKEEVYGYPRPEWKLGVYDSGLLVQDEPVEIDRKHPNQVLIDEMPFAALPLPPRRGIDDIGQVILDGMGVDVKRSKIELVQIFPTSPRPTGVSLDMPPSTVHIVLHMVGTSKGALLGMANPMFKAKKAILEAAVMRHREARRREEEQAKRAAGGGAMKVEDGEAEEPPEESG